MGPLDASPQEAAAIERLAVALGWPLLAEPLSQLRGATAPSPVLLDAGDALLRCTQFSDQHAPECVLRFGQTPTSKSLNRWLAEHPEIDQIVVSPSYWNEPSGVARQVLDAEPLRLACELLEQVTPRKAASSFAQGWLGASQRARSLIEAELDGRGDLSEAEIARSLIRLAPGGSRIYLGNSLPVRSAELYGAADRRGLQFFANRGANGIDGTLSSALGTAAVGDGRPCLAMIGDLALLHDWSGVALAREREINATLAVIDNGGGRIFESLPVARSAEREVFERHFLTPQGVDLPDALQAFRAKCTSVETRGEFEAALAEGLHASGVSFVCAKVDGSAHAEAQAKLLERIRNELEADA